MSHTSTQAPYIRFGLGQRKTVQSLEITQPSGIVDKLCDVPIDQIITVRNGMVVTLISFSIGRGRAVAQAVDPLRLTKRLDCSHGRTEIRGLLGGRCHAQS